MSAYDYIHINSKYLFAGVMGLGYNKNVLYPRPITIAKRYLLFYRCHGPYIFDKTVNIFMFRSNIFNVGNGNILQF